MKPVAPTELQFPSAHQCLFVPKRFKVLYGGRGGARSWSCSRALLLKGRSAPLRVLCVREFQNSIEESVHKVLSDQIRNLGWESFYDVQKTKIIGLNGTEFSFEGIKNNVNRIKSYEGIDICWAEEAVKLTKASLGVLIPTIRKENSEIWLTFNPELDEDYVYRHWALDDRLVPVTANRFAAPSDVVVRESNPGEFHGSFVVKTNYANNPWFPQVLRDEMEDLKARDYDAYLHVWEGNTVQTLDGVVYAKQLRQATLENRICSVPYERTVPVNTYWDIGKADGTGIWFAQWVGMQIRLLEYYEATNEDLEHFLSVLQSRRYIYGMHVLPHDAEQNRLGQKRTVRQQLEAHYPQRVRIAKKIKREDGIQATRLLFPKMFFDEEKTRDGLYGLRRYAYKVKDGILSKEPDHAWSCAADALRYLAVMIQDPDLRGESVETRAGRVMGAIENKWRELAPNLGWMGL